MSGEKSKQFLLMALLPAAGSIIMGLALFQRGIFNTERIGFQFFSFGIVGGIVFSSFTYLKKWIALVVVVGLLVVDELALHTGNWDFIWQDVLYYVGVSGVMIIFAVYYFPKLAGSFLGRLFVLSSLMSIVYGVMAIVFFMVFQANPAIPRFNVVQMLYYDLAQGLLLGFGLGAGVELADYALRKSSTGTTASQDYK